MTWDKKLFSLVRTLFTLWTLIAGDEIQEARVVFWPHPCQHTFCTAGPEMNLCMGYTWLQSGLCRGLNVKRMGCVVGLIILPTSIARFLDGSSYRAQILKLSLIVSVLEMVCLPLLGQLCSRKKTHMRGEGRKTACYCLLRTFKA